MTFHEMIVALDLAESNISNGMFESSETACLDVLATLDGTKAIGSGDSKIARIRALNVISYSKLKRGLSIESLALVEQALTLASDALEQESLIGLRRVKADALVRKGACLQGAGDYTLSLQYHNEALTIYDDIGDTVGYATCQLHIASALVHQSDIQGSIEILRGALRVFDEHVMPFHKAIALYRIAGCYYMLSQYDAAHQYIESALENLDELKNASLWADIMGLKGVIHYSRSEYADALRCNTDALSKHTTIGEVLGVAVDYLNIGNVYLRLGDFSRALDYYEKSQTISADIGDEYGVAIIVGNFGNVLWHLEDWKGASEKYREALEMHQKAGRIADAIRITSSIGSIESASGNYDRALEVYTQAQKLSIGNNIRIYLPEIYSGIGLVYTRTKKFEDALTQYQLALDDSTELEKRHNYANTLVQLGCIYTDEAFDGYDLAKAEKYLLDAERVTEELGARFSNLAVYEKLSLVYERQRRWEEAYVYRKKCHLLDKEILTDEVRQTTVMFETRRAVDESERLRKQERSQMENELSRQRQILIDKSLQLVQQAEMLKNIRGEFDVIIRHADTADKALREIQRRIRELPENVLNWQKFEEEFTVIHPDFQNTLRQNFPDLTKMELKVCCLLRLGMKSYEVATILFISERSVENHRLHLRKKLGLMHGAELQKVLEEL